MKLAECELGKELIIESIHLDSDHCFRLREIGITEGQSIQACQNCSFGSMVVSKGTERIGIDKKIANAIEVKYADDV